MSDTYTEQDFRDDIRTLLEELQPTIGDGYRATDDPEDDQPGMQVTIGANKDLKWSYQTGDNSYSGGAYFYPYWGVAYLYKDSDPVEEAALLVEEILEGIAQSQI